MATTIDKNSSKVITLKDAKDYTHEFQNEVPNEIKSFYAGSNKLNLILEQSGCIGIRIYNGLNATTGKKNLVLVGVNADGEDMVTGPILQDLITCPPKCFNSELIDD